MIIRVLALETTTTTTETSSDETDSDMRENELLYFDENVCPPGCDKKLYDLAFATRERRYVCEHQIKEAQRVMEELHKEIDILTKKLRITENSLRTNENDLRTFMVT